MITLFFSLSHSLSLSLFTKKNQIFFFNTINLDAHRVYVYRRIRLLVTLEGVGNVKKKKR